MEQGFQIKFYILFSVRRKVTFDSLIRTSCHIHSEHDKYIYQLRFLGLGGIGYIQEFLHFPQHK